MCLGKLNVLRWKVNRSQCLSTTNTTSVRPSAHLSLHLDFRSRYTLQYNEQLECSLCADWWGIAHGSLSSPEPCYTDYLTSFSSLDSLQGSLDSIRCRRITFNDYGRLNFNWGLASAQNFKNSLPVALVVHCNERIRPAEWHWSCIIIYLQYQW